MTGTLNIYILRLLLGPFALVISVLLLALSMERILRLIDDVSRYGAPFSKAFELLLYLVPHYLGLAIPAAVFMAVLIAFRKLMSNAELDVLKSSGVSLRRLAIPVVMFSGTAMLCLLILSAYIQPHTRYMFREAVHVMKENPFDFNLQPGIFQKMSDDITVRIDNFDQDSKSMVGFFAAFKADPNDTMQTSYIAAKRAKVIRDENNSEEVTVLLLDGQRVVPVSEGSSTSQPLTLKFEQFPWRPDLDITPYGPRGNDERELTLNELAHEKIDNLSDEVLTDNPIPKIRAEYHARLVQSLSLPILALLAIPLALLGQGRTGRSSGIIIGIVVIVFYEKILGFSEAFAASDKIPVWTAMWSPLILLLIATFTLFNHMMKR